MAIRAPPVRLPGTLPPKAPWGWYGAGTGTCSWAKLQAPYSDRCKFHWAGKIATGKFAPGKFSRNT